MLKFHYKHERLDFSTRTSLNIWEIMDDPEEPADADRTGLQGEDMRDAMDKILEAIEHEEGVFEELM